MSGKSQNSANISLRLSYDDAPRAFEWLGRAFGFTKRPVVPRETAALFILNRVWESCDHGRDVT